ncbi:YceI family protein [Alcaligenaceae bacterium]|nr:YceI family protein [Alcaligenaceae bacterium]
MHLITRTGKAPRGRAGLSLIRPLALAAALSFGLPGGAHAVEYKTLDAGASHISFGYSQMNVNMDGAFSELKAPELSFDPENPEAARVAIEISLASVDAGYAEANAELEKDEWLDLPAHPLASFRSSKVESLGDGRYQVTGELSIKGKSKEVTAPFDFKEDGDSGVFEGGFTFQRADFGIGEGQWSDFSIVANDIQIRFHIVARP